MSGMMSGIMSGIVGQIEVVIDEVFIINTL